VPETALVERSPVLFRRTAASATLPMPLSGGNVSDLRGLLNVSDATWPLVLGWLVAAFFPDIAHPILLIGGEQGTGKSTAARLLLRLFDPSTAELRSPPRDVEGWAIAAAGSWGVVVDNVSDIFEWFSDALCRAATGDGWIRRRLYTDGDLAVLRFRRVVALTSIDPGALRGDLGDRLVIVDLLLIPEDQRLGDRELEERYAALRPAVLGALLNLTASVLAALPSVRPARLPRMADFGLVLAAMDRVLGTTSLELFLTQRGRIASDVVDDDPVGESVAALVTSEGEWIGPAGELLSKITPQAPAKGWPRNARGLAGRLKRLTPALRAVGVEIVAPAQADKTRRWTIRGLREGQHTTAQTARSALAGDRVPERVAGHGSFEANGENGRSGHSGGPNLSLSDDSASAPVETCRWCGVSEWWRLPESPSGWTCGRCHPPVRKDVIFHKSVYLHADSACEGC
jgi:hypothetical protein